MKKDGCPPGKIQLGKLCLPTKGKPRKTNYGSSIYDSFMMSPSDQNMDLFLYLLDNGYTEMYYTAPYHWGAANPKDKKIVTYTEGDISVTTCKDPRILKVEVSRHHDFIKDNYPHASNEWVLLDQRIDKEIKK